MITRTRDAVEALNTAIASRIGEARYKLWFERNARLKTYDDQLIVGVPNRHFQEWLERTFAGDVAAVATEIFQRPMTVRFTIDPQLFQAARAEQEGVAKEIASPGPHTAARHSGTERGKKATPPHAPLSAPERGAKLTDASCLESAGLPPRPTAASRTKQGDGVGSGQKPLSTPQGSSRSRRWHRLSDFVVGPCNRVAHASALSVIETPGETANPLMLHGPVGTGKTHLLEGIYAGLRRSRPDWRVSYVTSEEFTNRFVQAMRHDKLTAFRRQFREVDVLLLDDLHFLAKKKATQEEFLHTFDALLADGRQVVLTCDCHPRLADDFPPELVDRLLGGAVWALTPPDADTRLAILRQKGTQGGPSLPDVVLNYLAGQLRGNVRELEGAIHGIRHFSRVTGRSIDVALVREALGELLRHAVRVVQVADVDRVICGLLRLEAGTLQKQARVWAVSHPRMVAMYLSRKHTAASYGDIGVHFGGRNHSTVVAAEKKVRGWIEKDEELGMGERRVRVRELLERAERELFR